MKAVIYARWSSLEQGKGSSLERQMDLCERFCAEQGWEILERLRDEGKSAYTGANLQDGKLAEFTKRVENQLLADDVVLVVEQLDRISRLPPGQVIAWIQKVIGHGLTIATANDKLVLDTRKLEVDPIGIVSTVFNAFRAFQEANIRVTVLRKAGVSAGRLRNRGGRSPAFVLRGLSWIVKLASLLKSPSVWRS